MGMPEFLPTRDHIISIREKYRGNILTDQEILDLVVHGSPDQMEDVSRWLGVGIDEDKRPLQRFSEVLANNFGVLSLSEKEVVLVNGFRFVLGDFNSKYRFATTYGYYEYEHLGMLSLRSNLGSKLGSNLYNNLGELLISTLEFSNNDLSEARKLVRKIPFSRKYERNFASVALYNFYSLRVENDTLTPEEQEELNTADKYRRKNQRITPLAFWLGVKTGTYSPRSPTFENLLRDRFPQFDGVMKTQVMSFMNEQLLLRQIPKTKYKNLERFLLKNEKLYEAVKIRYPDSPFVEYFNSTKRILALDQMLEKTEGGKIKVEDLVILLEEHETLIQYVTMQELEKALDQTREHGLALRIERLIRARRSHPKESSATI